VTSDERGEVSTLARGVRLDLVIAVCALLVSSLATAASWWQTRVIQQQLSAQVWPYVSTSAGIDHDVAQVSVTNDGLGPAIIRSATITVDGKRQRDFIAVMHAILGPGIVRRKPRGEHIALSMSETGPGSVLRVGDPFVLFSLTSKHFAAPFIRGFARVNTRICYCAIVPDTCWIQDSNTSQDPQPVHSCPQIADDLLHVSTDALFTNNF
jgi:hypothetical protein